MNESANFYIAYIKSSVRNIVEYEHPSSKLRIGVLFVSYKYIDYSKKMGQVLG